MVYLAFIYHMHQPYYKNLLTDQTEFPWVRLHGTKDYLDMVEMLDKFPAIHQTFNLVPGLIEQLDDYINGKVKDKFLEHSYLEADKLTDAQKSFILENFFMINKDKVILYHPRYYDLYLRKQNKVHFTAQDYRDLQVWFNLAWIDPSFREEMPELRKIVAKARYFTEQDKGLVLGKHIEILERIIPAYKAFMEKNQVEVILSPYYHPILPLLYNSRIAKEANQKSILPHAIFSYPEDVQAQLDLGVALYKEKFGRQPEGMWPSEQAVCEHILPFFMKAGIKWIVADEGVLFKSLKKKKRDTRILYQPHRLKREDGELAIVFRDRNLSDLIGFNYADRPPKDAVGDFMRHLENIHLAYGSTDILVTIAMDGENAWEYFIHDGHDFLEQLYQRISETPYIKTTTINEYLRQKPAKHEIKRLSAGSWIYGEFSKWVNNPHKNKGWDYLAVARREIEDLKAAGKPVPDLAMKQMHILEGSDWFWWLGEDYPGYFDRLYRMHLQNFYTLINKEIPEYLKHPIVP